MNVYIAVTRKFKELKQAVDDAGCSVEELQALVASVTCMDEYNELHDARNRASLYGSMRTSAEQSTTSSPPFPHFAIRSRGTHASVGPQFNTAPSLFTTVPRAVSACRLGNVAIGLALVPARRFAWRAATCGWHDCPENTAESVLTPVAWPRRLKRLQKRNCNRGHSTHSPLSQHRAQRLRESTVVCGLCCGSIRATSEADTTSVATLPSAAEDTRAFRQEFTEACVLHRRSVACLLGVIQ